MWGRRRGRKKGSQEVTGTKGEAGNQLNYIGKSHWTSCPPEVGQEPLVGQEPPVGQEPLSTEEEEEEEVEIGSFFFLRDRILPALHTGVMHSAKSPIDRTRCAWVLTLLPFLFVKK